MTWTTSPHAVDMSLAQRSCAAASPARRRDAPRLYYARRVPTAGYRVRETSAALLMSNGLPSTRRGRAVAGRVHLPDDGSRATGPSLEVSRGDRLYRRRKEEPRAAQNKVMRTDTSLLAYELRGYELVGTPLLPRPAEMRGRGPSAIGEQHVYRNRQGRRCSPDRDDQLH